MPIAHYLAMTAGEIAGGSGLPHQIAWMASHFSPCSSGLSNLPKWLPSGSLLILDDSTPIEDHDPERIAAQLRTSMEQLQCAGLLLDFQRPGVEKIRALTRYLCQTLPHLVVVSDQYAGDLDCGVFLSPIPPDSPMAPCLSQWHGREIWLDTTTEGLEITLTEQGAISSPLSSAQRPEEGQEDKNLHCHYRILAENDRAVFSLWRTKEDVAAQLAEAEALGVTAAVGLFQEFGSPLPKPEEG